MPTEKTLIQQGGKLLDLYLKLYEEKAGRAIVVNRYKEKFKMKDVVESVGFERAKEIMEYYFRTTRTSYPIDWFVYNFDKLNAVMIERRADEVKKKMMAEATRKRVEAWERKKNESRSESD